MLDVMTDVGPDWPEDTDWTALADRAVRAALALAQTTDARLIDARLQVEVSVKLSDDGEVRQLNAAYRGKDKPTNVLSFPMVQPDLIEALANTDDGEALLGDIILARETCAREASERGISLESHATHLIVHGTLHLIGHDHEDDVQAETMEAIEIRALETLGLADPYGDRERGDARPIDETGT
ncbi:rRNA maturation RNase YbeY [Sphingobium lignivorans]|uniref:Endoribonuclease YbeY n=1 Tax=Sphingobium lignivorans TaxID=2735886 RepID=A0ABR6NI91_9SPHN|nr:rRNA maturation RNase YbeY [Sphingobium lignivorans]MBB5986981.1 putative rRNA maturation factor [Sphingobium lignivorans]